jgi:outer membrane protein
MKKVLIFSALCIGLLSANVATAQKFGYTNSVALLQEMPEIKGADAELDAFQQQLQKRGQEMVASLQTKAADLEKRQGEGTIARKQFDDESAALQAEETEIQAYEQKMYDLIGKKKEEKYKPILDKVNEAMKMVAKEAGLLLVFDSSTGILLYADESQDVTKLVKTKLGLI